MKVGCFDCKSTKNLRAIHNFYLWYVMQLKVVSTAKVQKIWEQFTTDTANLTTASGLFRLQKYKKFESNSQRQWTSLLSLSCCFDCKSTKNLRAIHNWDDSPRSFQGVVSTAKVQKIWEQFTTRLLVVGCSFSLFRLQKYKKFESNSQLPFMAVVKVYCCFDCKSTKNLRAIHNNQRRCYYR